MFISRSALSPIGRIKILTMFEEYGHAQTMLKVPMCLPIERVDINIYIWKKSIASISSKEPKLLCMRKTKTQIICVISQACLNVCFLLPR